MKIQEAATDYFACRECGHIVSVDFQCGAGEDACMLCCRCYPSCEEERNENPDSGD